MGGGRCRNQAGEDDGLVQGGGGRDGEERSDSDVLRSREFATDWT